MEKRDVVIIGGGSAGLAAAVKLHENGVRDILIIEREKQPGGVLRQCIHDGFGLTRFGVSKSGPEYTQRFIDEAEKAGIEILTNATVFDLSRERVVTVNTREGLRKIQAKAVVLTMGCRERTRGALAIPGARPSGVYNAGVAQSYVNLYNTMVGKEVIIMGSGDIGMIMARRLTLEGAHVKAMFEILPYPSGLPRNIEQCLHDYDIPLYLSRSVVQIHGEERISGVTVMDYDENLNPKPGTEEFIPCDTLIMSVGLIPENELSLKAGVALDARTNGALVDEFYQTTVPGIFAAGNVLHVHDLVDFVSLEAEALADSVSRYVLGGALPASAVEIKANAPISYTVPQRVSGAADFRISMRVRRPVGRCRVELRQGGELVAAKTLQKAIPAEMIQLDIKSENIRTTQEIEVTVNEI